MTTIEKARAVYGVMEKRAAVQRRNYVRGLLCDYMHKKAADQQLPLTLQQATGLQGIPSTTGKSVDQAKRDSNNLINAPATQPKMPVSGMATAVAGQLPQWIAKGNAAIARGAQYAANSIDNMAQRDPAFYNRGWQAAKYLNQALAAWSRNNLMTRARTSAAETYPVK